MHISDLPPEILSDILNLATQANEASGESFTYGLSQAPLPPQKVKLTRYVRGPLSAESLKWDSTRSIRQVCSAWHEWALSYNLEHVYERRWRGSERWAELSRSRRRYSIYELIENPSGYAVYQDPFGSLRQTERLFASIPSLTRNVRRLWFNGFHTAETDKLILSVVRNCAELQFLSVPWTILRRSTAEDWVALLNVNSGRGQPLHSLEIQAVCLPKDQASALESDHTANPLEDSRVSFAGLRRLKIFGNTLTKPVDDQDLSLIARTADHLEVLDITNLNTVSVAGMLQLVRASRSTLQVLEHSPRSDDGFFHHFPGDLPNPSSSSDPESHHTCKLFTSLPRMRDLSVSIPYMCAELFTPTSDIHWVGECQVRATDLCTCTATTSAAVRAGKLREVFAAARRLVRDRQRMQHQLSIELFFAGCIFEPEKNLVHGDFVLAEIRSRGQWPRGRQTSTKGPYGTTGVYGKDEAPQNWDAVWEDDYLAAVEKGWVQL